MNEDLGVWTADECALVLDVIYWYFTQAPKHTHAVGVAEAEKKAAAAHFSGGQ
jgi:hypothetical protein